MKKQINHFSYKFDLPEQSSIKPYTPSKNQHTKSQKNQLFSYFIIDDHINKILILDDKKCIDQGNYPFTNPLGQVLSFLQIQAKIKTKLFTVEAAYIGHLDKQIIIKKIQGVKFDEKSAQIQTIDDNFEIIAVGNEPRFEQFKKIMHHRPNALNTSIRVIINESQQQPKVIDFQFFQRQIHLRKHHSKSE